MVAQHMVPPGLWARLFVGVVGASVTVSGPIWTWVSTTILTDGPLEGAQPVVTGIIFGLAFAWLLSVFLTAYIKEDHILKCLLTSIGLPGIVVSMAVGFQSIQ